MPKSLLLLLLVILLPVPGGALASGDVSAGERKAQTCVRCHGTGGISTNPRVPPLAGLPAEHFIEQMYRFRSGERRSTPMRDVTRRLSDEDIADLAAWFESLGDSID